MASSPKCGFIWIWWTTGNVVSVMWRKKKTVSRWIYSIFSFLFLKRAAAGLIFYEISFDLTDLCKQRSDLRRAQGFEGGLNMLTGFSMVPFKNKLKKFKVHTRTNCYCQVQIIIKGHRSLWFTPMRLRHRHHGLRCVDSYKYSILVKAWCFHLWIKAASVTSRDQQQMESFTFLVHTWAQIKVPPGSEGQRWEDFLCLSFSSSSIPPVIHSQAAANKARRKSASLGIPSW